jgi:DNA-binding transcriptional LysR family regulator
MTAVELRQLHAFVVVAEELHFGRAALRLELSPSALSRTIVDLEGTTEVRLLDRSQRTVGLTEAGRELLPAARAMLRDFDLALSNVRDPHARTPVLGILGSAGHTFVPDLEGELAIRGAAELEVRTIELEDGFEPLSHAVDVGIYPLPLVPPFGLEHLVIGHSNPWVALRSGHPLTEASTVPLSALAGEPVVLPRAHAVWWDNLRAIVRGHGSTLTTGPEASSLYAALMLVAAGHGWTLAAARSDFPHWEGVDVRPLAGVERFRVAAVWRRTTPQARLLVDALGAIAR